MSKNEKKKETFLKENHISVVLKKKETKQNETKKNNNNKSNGVLTIKRQSFRYQSTFNIYVTSHSTLVTIVLTMTQYFS